MTYCTFIADFKSVMTVHALSHLHFAADLCRINGSALIAMTGSAFVFIVGVSNNGYMAEIYKIRLFAEGFPWTVIGGKVGKESFFR